MIEFKPWGKTPRMFRDVVITEKLDGTNAAIIIEDISGIPAWEGPYDANVTAYVDDLASGRYAVGAQSRNRIITPGDDNYGFAAWVRDNAEGLVAILGPGHHFGEWWGSGIQRGYGLTNGEKRFSLFNVARYGAADFSSVPGLGVVPVLYEGPFGTFYVKNVLNDLATEGSKAAPGFARPEGLVVFHTAAQQVFKVLIENDELPKGAAA